MTGLDVGPDEVAVVVGGTGAVGEAVVRRIIALGLPVIAVARSADSLADLVAQTGGEGGAVVEACEADVSTDESVARIESAVGSRRVRLALFAGGLAVAGSADAIAASELARAADVKVGGTVRLLHAVRDHLADDARLIAIGGSLGFEPGPMDAGPGTVNAALANLMRQVSKLYGPKGLVTMMIAPGPLDTPRLRAVAARRAEESGRKTDEVYGDYVSATSIGALPTADDVAWLAETLLHPQARALHGNVLHPDGGVRHGVG